MTNVVYRMLILPIKFFIKISYCIEQIKLFSSFANIIYKEYYKFFTLYKLFD